MGAVSTRSMAIFVNVVLDTREKIVIKILMNVPKILANMEAVLTWSMTIFVNVVPDIREKIVMKKLMNVSLILANMEAVLTWSMTILVNAVPDTREKIVMKHPCDQPNRGGCEQICNKVGTQAICACKKRGATPNI